MMIDSPHVLVTDITGFVASHVANVLQRSGFRVRGTVPKDDAWKSIKGFFKSNEDMDSLPIEIVGANLSNEASWTNAVKDCSYVIHNICPYAYTEGQDDEQSVMTCSVKNVMFVLRACRAAGTVQRLILTSSTAAIEYGSSSRPPTHVYTEEDWSDTSAKDITLYGKAMTLVEEAAWNFVSTLPKEERIELVVLNPGFPIGSALINFPVPNFLLIRDLVEHKITMVPRIFIPVVDVGDLAQAHLHALTCPEAAGNRHILVTETVALIDIALVLNDHFCHHGYKISTTPLPNIFAKALSVFERSMKSIRSQLGKKTLFDNTRMRTILKIDSPHKIQDSLIEMVHSLIKHGIIVRASQYKMNYERSSIITGAMRV